MGSRKCGGVSRRDIGRKMTTTTPANCPPQSVSCRGVGMMASFQAETAAISVCLAGLAGVLVERGFLESAEELWGLQYQCPL